MHTVSDAFVFRPDRPPNTTSSDLERLKLPPYTYNGMTVSSLFSAVYNNGAILLIFSGIYIKDMH